LVLPDDRNNPETAPGVTETRRDFLGVLAGAMGLVGAGFCIWPLLGSLAPAPGRGASTGPVTISLATIPAGTTRTVVWDGKPVIIRHRTPEEIAKAAEADTESLRDPASDSARTHDPRWLVISGVCTHLGCLTEPQADGRFFCPCHASRFDESGRVLSGPAPKNLNVPPHRFIGGNRIQIG
jgi:ubiquinol-cytochrome c reductase iron-sulfur subunit